MVFFQFEPSFLEGHKNLSTRGKPRREQKKEINVLDNVYVECEAHLSLDSRSRKHAPLYLAGLILVDAPRDFGLQY